MTQTHGLTPQLSKAVGHETSVPLAEKSGPSCCAFGLSDKTRSVEKQP